MPKVELNQVRALNAVVHLNDWRIKFATVPSGAGLDALANDVDIRAISVDIPRATLLPIQVDIRGHRYFVPGDTEFTPTITLTLLETDDMQVMNALNSWRDGPTPP